MDFNADILYRSILIAVGMIVITCIWSCVLLVAAKILSLFFRKD